VRPVILGQVRRPWRLCDYTPGSAPGLLVAVCSGKHSVDIQLIRVPAFVHQMKVLCLKGAAEAMNWSRTIHSVSKLQQVRSAVRQPLLALHYVRQNPDAPGYYVVP